VVLEKSREPLGIMVEPKDVKMVPGTNGCDVLEGLVDLGQTTRGDALSKKTVEKKRPAPVKVTKKDAEGRVGNLR